MQMNKNGIPIKTSSKKTLIHKLDTRRFRLIDDEAEVEVVLPLFSPIIQICLQDGWEEVKE